VKHGYFSGFTLFGPGRIRLTAIDAAEIFRIGHFKPKFLVRRELRAEISGEVAETLNYNQLDLQGATCQLIGGSEVQIRQHFPAQTSIER
jgi:hypothetical protein